MKNRNNWLPLENDAPIPRREPETVSRGTASGFHDDRRFYARERKIERAQDRLDKRYMRGEITDSEYLAACDALE